MSGKRRLRTDKYVELSAEKKRPRQLEVVIGSDDPMFLLEDEAERFALKVAKNHRYSKLVHADDEVRVFGQNELTQRTFIFRNDWDDPYIKDIEADSSEMTIKAIYSQDDLLEDTSFLTDVVREALYKGYSRFVGMTEPGEDKEWTFFFSIEDYYDNDDALVRHFEASKKVERIIKKLKR